MGVSNSKTILNDYDRLWGEVTQLGMNIKCLTCYATAYGFTEDIQKRHDNFYTQITQKQQEIEDINKKEQENINMEEKKDRERRLHDSRDLLKEFIAEYARFKSARV
jgi:hypothetical protein